MNEQPKTIRPTKKQKELLTYIESFIAENGYSPSYREIMRALDYNSVATVALHVGNLVKRGHLVKRDKSARSLEVVNVPEDKTLKSNSIKPSEEKWLVEKVEYFFSRQESNSSVEQNSLDELYVLIGSLKIMGLEGAAQSFIPRLTDLKRKVK
jgi:SOS-response transcriptional repressor LexA